jgi:hypothetical protein
LQKDKKRHPNSKFSIDQPLYEQTAKYTHFARAVGYWPEQMRAHSSKIQARVYASFKKVGRKELNPQSDILVEHGHYNPNYFVGNASIPYGLVPMRKMTDRTYLPTGRPHEHSSNLVSLQPERGVSIKSDSVMKGYASLGHLHNIS